MTQRCEYSRLRLSRQTPVERHWTDGRAKLIVKQFDKVDARGAAVVAIEVAAVAP